MKQPRIFQTLAAPALLALAYFVAGKLGLSLASTHPSASVVWPPTGIALAALLVLGHRVWPGIFVGAFLVNITTAGDLATSLGIATGNTLEGLAGAWLINRFAHGRDAFNRAHDVFRFTLLAALLSTMLSATIGVTSLALTGFAKWANYRAIWRDWWLGDAVGAMIVTPLLVSWAVGSREIWTRTRIVEAAALLALLIILATAIFGAVVPSTTIFPMPFLVMPLLVWIGLRFAQREAATAMFILAVIAVWAVVRDAGPFASGARHGSLLLLQAFLGVVAIVSTVTAAEMSERRATERRLDVQQATARILAESPELTEAMARIMETICTKLQWEIGNFWQIDPQANCVECVQTWISPTKAAKASEFIAASKRSKFAVGTGLPGRAWQGEGVVWIDDVRSDPNFPRAPFAGQAGLQSGFAFPVVLGGKVLGVVEFFSPESRRATEELITMMAAIGSQIGQFIERKQAEAAVSESAEHFRTMAETASDAFLTIDESSTILFANRAAERTFGYSAKEMLGQKLTMLMPEDKRAGHRQGVARHLSTGRKQIPWQSVELPGRHKDGHIFPMEISIGVFIKNDRKIFTGIARDITERKRTERMLAQYAFLVGSSSDAIYSKTLEGIITSWNKSAELLYGYPASEILGKDVQTMVPPERLAEEREILARIARGEQIASYETVRLRKDGTRIDVSLTISPVKTSDGKISGASAIARDIAEHKRAAAELERRKDEAEAANRAKDNFLAMLSHELRTPLTPVISAVDELEAALAPSGEVQDALAMIRRNVELEARLIDDLLDLTRIVKGRIELHRQPLDAHECLQEVIELCRSEIGSKCIELQLDLQAEEHFVNADPTKLPQIIWNLLKNAVKFSKERGRITIRSENPVPDQLAIQICDEGIGIEPDVMPRIFQPFEQGESAIQRRFGGLGLGLAISKALAIAHDGTLAATSRGHDRGATFSLTLEAIPTPTWEHKVEPPSAPPSKPPGDLHILLVDDHEDTRQALERLLRRRGYQVESAPDMRTALALAGKRSFDLLVSDIGLPDGSGLELMSQLRRKSKIAGIAVSGFGMEGDVEKSKSVGFSAHLLKPLDFATLDAAIQRIAAGL
jgi:PAS domain S-box-containing protein